MWVSLASEYGSVHLNNIEWVTLLSIHDTPSPSLTGRFFVQKKKGRRDEV
ncbi:hypothetical protein RintRC_5866 [Richelia intracellularis]|nr:hypothetical protein RintRC_5866 [Richelia intracellularis]